MDNKKDIGKLFKERLDSLESKPNDAIWGALEKQLKKDNKKVFPFWLKLTTLGVLAFLLSLTFYQLNTSSSNTNPPQTTEEVNALNKTLNKNDDLLKADTLNTSTTNSSLTKEVSSAKSDATTTTTITTTGNQKNNLKTQNSKAITANKQSDQRTLNNPKLNSNSLSKLNTTSKSNLNSNSGSSSQLVSNSASTPLSNSVSNNLSGKHVRGKKSLLETSSIIAENNLKTNAIVALNDATISLDLIPFAIESNEKSETAVAQHNYIIETFGGPLLFSAPSNSSLDTQLNNNKKSGNVSFNYGAAIRFKFSEKTSIRLGIAKTDLVYVTENVASTNEQGNIVSLNNILGLDLDFNALENINDNNILGGNSAVDLRQEYSYLEIPVEIDYRVIDKKINVNVFGGVSLLTLNNNTIYAQSSNSNKVDIGKANNLNKLNLSLNTGTNFSTNLFENIELNLRPTFKYYFKTIGKSNIKFNPFTFGVNIGLSYSF